MAETTKRQQSGNRKPGRPKGSTSKKTGTSSKSRRTTGKKAYEQDNTEFMRAEVVIICSFAVAILLFLSNFKLCGVVGDVLRGVQLGIFGIVGYIFPILIFVGTHEYQNRKYISHYSKYPQLYPPQHIAHHAAQLEIAQK